MRIKCFIFEQLETAAVKGIGTKKTLKKTFKNVDFPSNQGTNLPKGISISSPLAIQICIAKDLLGLSWLSLQNFTSF